MAFIGYSSVYHLKDALEEMNLPRPISLTEVIE